MNNELDFVAWLTEQQPVNRRVGLGIGDDMAVLLPDEGLSLLSSDMLLDGVHFDTTIHRPEQIGRKAIACCLSDCAAMAVNPVAATVSLALPKTCELSWMKQLFTGMLEMASSFEVAIVGGDTTAWAGRLAIDVCISAMPWPGVDPISRCGARAGDELYVTGKLGGSLRGRHMTFTPRIHEARRIAESLGANLHAMMDISDGLSLDCWRLCQASDVGCMLDERLLKATIHTDAQQASRDDGQPAISHALCDGEDFELLLAGRADDFVELPIIAIGVVTESSKGMTMKQLDGSSQTLRPKGFVH